MHPEDIRNIPNSTVCPTNNLATNGYALSESSNDSEPTAEATLEEEEGGSTYHPRPRAFCFTQARTMTTHRPTTRSLRKRAKSGCANVAVAHNSLRKTKRKVTLQALHDLLYLAMRIKNERPHNKTSAVARSHHNNHFTKTPLG